VDGWSDKAFVLYYSHATKQSREQAGQSLEKLAGKKNRLIHRIRRSAFEIYSMVRKGLLIAVPARYQLSVPPMPESKILASSYHVG
jgi:hypothetical protein